MKFTPIFQPRVWGGRNLASLGKKLPSRRPIGESWELCDRAETQTVVANGPLAGKTLGEIWKFLLPDHPSAFPLLIKWLDVVEPLSLQVHPETRVARRVGGEPKTEAWCIVAASHDAKIWAGLKRGVTRRQLARAIADGSAERLLRSFHPRVGEMIFLPAGCVHAARGVLALEVQQNSDTTFRLYDWGRDRQLQVQEGLQSVNPRLLPKRGKSVRCPFFSLRAVTFRRAWPSPRKASMVCIAGGAGKIRWHDGQQNYGAGDCWLLPVECRLEPQRTTAAIFVEGAFRRFL